MLLCVASDLLSFAGCCSYHIKFTTSFHSLTTPVIIDWLIPFLSFIIMWLFASTSLQVPSFLRRSFPSATIGRRTFFQERLRQRFNPKTQKMEYEDPNNMAKRFYEDRQRNHSSTYICVLFNVVSIYSLTLNLVCASHLSILPCTFFTNIWRCSSNLFGLLYIHSIHLSVFALKYNYYEKPTSKKKRLAETKIYRRQEVQVKELIKYIQFMKDHEPKWI